MSTSTPDTTIDGDGPELREIQSPCPQPTCHGSLEHEEDSDGENRYLCYSCRCRPDGTYVPPASRGSDKARNRQREATIGPYGEQDRPTYEGSGKAVMYGAFYQAWPDEKLGRDSDWLSFG